MGWETIIYMVIAAVISIALAPKPPKPKAATLEDFDLPTAEEGRPVPVVFGTVRITGSNVLWYGDLSTKAIKKKSLFSSATIGYQYFLGIHFGLCHGPVDAILKFEAGDKTAWTGSQTANGSITVSQSGLFGGKKKEGGLVGALDVALGGSAQTANTYLTSEIGGTIPAFRGITSLVWHGGGIAYGRTGGYIGTSAYIKPFAFTVRRALQGWHNNTVWYSAKALIGTGMNPAHIIYEAVTNPEWGCGLPTSVIDTASFTAVADTLHAEGFGLSLIWNRDGKVEDFLQQVLDHVAGILAFNRSTGKYQLTLLRGDYSPGSLVEYGPDKVLEVRSYQRQAWGETCNELTVKYTDAASLKTASVTVHDLGNIASQGVRITQVVDYPGITSDSIAQKVAGRELTARSTPLAKVTFSMDRTAWANKQGDLVRLTWPKLGLNQVVLRIFTVRTGTLTDGAIELEGIEDIFGMPANVYTSQPGLGGDPTGPTYDDDPETQGASVISATTTAPPGSPVDGDTYLVPTGATGAWSTHVGEVATWDADDAVWVFSIPTPGTVVTVTSTGTQVQTVTGATATAYTPIQTSGQVIFGTAITPAALAANQNDYAPTGLATASGLRLSASGAARTITGLTGGVQGRMLLVHNVGSLDLNLADEDVASVAANRFALNAAVILKADQSTLLQYDGTSSRWRVIGGTGSGGLPSGGAAGEVLAKNSATDGDVFWTSIAAGLTGVAYYEQIVLGDGAARYYPANEATGLPKDMVGGTLTAFVGGSGTTYNQGTRGVRGRHVTVTTAGNMIWPMGGSGAANPAYANCSLEAWFKSSSSLSSPGAFYAGAFLVGSDTGGGGPYVGLSLQGPCLPMIGYGAGSTVQTPSGSLNFADNVWHHVVATRNSTTGAAEIFVDGVSVVSGNTGAGVASSQPTNFWTGLNAIGFNGSVQHVAVYSSILTADQIKTHHAAGRALLGTGGAITMNTNKLLGRTTAGSGAAEEITVGTGLSLAAGVLTNTVTGGGGGGSGSGMGYLDLDVSPNPNAYDDEFKVTQSGTLAGWTILGSLDTLSTNVVKSALRMRKTSPGVFQVHGIYKAAPSIPFTVTTKFSGRLQRQNFQHYGLMLAEATPGKLFLWGPLWQGSVGGEEMFYSTWTSRTSRTTPAAEFGGRGDDQTNYFRLVVNSSTNIDVQSSKDGVLWQTVAAGINPGFTVGAIGFGMAGNEYDVPLECLIDWIRVGDVTVRTEAEVLQSLGSPRTGTQFSGASAKFNANKAVVANVKWAWDAAEWDTDGYWNAANPSRLTIPPGGAGKYLVTAQADGSVSGADFDLALYKNGVWIGEDYNAGGYVRYNLSKMLDLVEGDYVEVGNTVTNHTQHATFARFQITRMSGAYTQEGTGLTHVDAPPASPTEQDDEFDAAVLDSKWAWHNQGSATVVNISGAIKVTAPAAAGQNLRILKQATSGATWKYRAKVAMHGGANYNSAGLSAMNSVSGKIIAINKVYSGGFAIGVSKYTSATAYSSALAADNTALINRFGSTGQFLYLEIEYDGTTVYYRASGDGVEFDLLASEAAVAGFFGAAPDTICLHVNAENASNSSVGVFEWFRRIDTNYAPGKLMVNGAANGDIFPRLKPPLASAFPTKVNFGSTTVADKVRRMVVSTVGVAALQPRIQVNTAPAAPYTVTFAFTDAHFSNQGHITGLVLRNSGSGSFVTFELLAESGKHQYRVLHWPAPNSGPTSAYNSAFASAGGNLNWLRITSDGTTRKYLVSQNGKDWTELSSVAHTNYVTPDQIGIYTYNYDASFTGKTSVYHYEVTNSVLGDDA